MALLVFPLSYKATTPHIPLGYSLTESVYYCHHKTAAITCTVSSNLTYRFGFYHSPMLSRTLEGTTFKVSLSVNAPHRQFSAGCQPSSPSCQGT